MLPFWKLTPGGNPTILLQACDVPAPLRSSVANAVMDAQHIGGEQVGYVRFEGTPRLDMMGGEFCLNATRAFASLLAGEGLLTPGGGCLSGQVEVSGMPDLVTVRVWKKEGALDLAEVCLHLDELPSPEAVREGLSIVRVPGIVHLVHLGDPPHASCAEGSPLHGYCREQRKALLLEHEEAVGHLWLRRLQDSHVGKPRLDLSPVVWVRDTASLCFESACGSGTLACALAEHAQSGATSIAVRQPSGLDLDVRLERGCTGWNVWVGGPVRMTASGMTDLTGLL